MQRQRGHDGCGGVKRVRRGSEGEEGAESEEGCGGRLPTASKFGTSFGGPYFGKPVFSFPFPFYLLSFLYYIQKQMILMS